MIPSPVASSPLVAGYSRAAKPSFTERSVLRSFAALQRGHLRMELPNGSIHSFGGGPASAPGHHEFSDTATIRIRDSAFFGKCFWFGDIGFAEAFMDGDWDTPSLSAVIAWFILNVDQAPTLSGSQRAQSLGLNTLRFANRVSHLLRPNSRRTAQRNIREHYDLSNEFFALWLDRSMMYSSAKWTRPGLSLEEAQREKNRALCDSLRLKPTDRVLEIGTGWGGWAIYAAKTYGCSIITLTLSPQQFDYAVQSYFVRGFVGQDHRQTPRLPRRGGHLRQDCLDRNDGGHRPPLPAGFLCGVAPAAHARRA